MSSAERKFRNDSTKMFFGLVKSLQNFRSVQVQCFWLQTSSFTVGFQEKGFFYLA